MNRDEAVEALVSTGKTRDQARAFLDLLASGFRRRGWIEGEPLTQDEIGDRFDTFVGDRRPPASPTGMHAAASESPVSPSPPERTDQ